MLWALIIVLLQRSDHGLSETDLIDSIPYRMECEQNGERSIIINDHHSNEYGTFS